MSNLSLFPVLDDKLTLKMGLTKVKKIECSYVVNGQRKTFSYDEGGESISLDAHGWDKTKDAISISAQYRISNPDSLFGPLGVACQNATLGIAIIWKAKDSRQRGTIPIRTFSKGSNENLFEIDFHDFKPAQFRGRVLLESVIYLHEAGMPSADEGHLANIPGTIFGIIDKVNLYFDGEGASCQYYEISEAGRPLWTVDCDFEDPLIDNFYDSVRIVINRANSAYKYIDATSSEYNPEMLKEIFAEQMCIVLLTIKAKTGEDQWKAILDGLSDKDSVGDVLMSFYKRGFDYSTPSSCSDSIRRYIIDEDFAL